MWIDVDAAITVPVNLMPLIDDTDQVSRETGIVYNQAGMDLVWNFQTTAGVTTQTAVTPTTGGDYDWINSGDGMYKIEIPASGGASINNDTEGFGWFSGICTGVLAWRGPVVGFRAAALNNALIDGGDVLDMNLVEISGDAPAADNLEATYDGTGYTEDSAPAKQSQLASLSNVGSAVHRPAASYTLTTGTQSANTVSETEALDGVRHEHTDVGNAIDLYYEFSIGSGTPSSVQVTGYITGNNDDLDVYGYDWVAAAWVQIGNIQGSASTANQVNSFDMFVDMVGSGANSGVVRVRFFKTSGLTTALLAVDQIFVAFSQGVAGYEGGAVWYDSDASNTNTVVDIDGTSRNPVSTIGAVNTLLAATNLKIVQVAPGSTVTLTASQNSQIFRGHNWNLALGNQDIGGSHFFGAIVSGIGTGSSEIDFHGCTFNTCTLAPFHAVGCTLNEVTITFSEAGTYILHDCHSAVAGAATPVIDTGAAVGSVDLSMSDYANGIEVRNLNAAGTDKFSISGKGQVIYAASSSGDVHQRGDWKVANTGGVNIIADDNTTSIEAIEVDTADMQPKLGTPAGASLAADLATNKTHLTDIKGATWSSSTDTLEAIRNRGDSVWTTATGFSTHSQADVWAVASRLLTAGTNIALAKGVGLTGLNDLSTTQVNTEVDNALNTAIPGSPTANSINERVVAIDDLTQSSGDGDLAAIKVVTDSQARAAASIADGVAISGTLSTTEMTTDLTVAVAEQLKGRRLIFATDTTTAALRGQATDITDVIVSGSKLVFTAMTTAPVVGDTFSVV